MSKPRIIIADTNIDYIIPLQLKFIEEFFERINLEVITDKDYFDTCFADPQSAEILVVSEELYDSTLIRHNIGKIFLMTEQYAKEQTAELNVDRIFKYTSIKEIFNEIIGKSASVLELENNVKQEPQIIVVTSAAGGVGKTTTAIGLCACLTKNFKKVLYINTDQLQTFQYLFENQSPIVDSEMYSNLMKNGETAYKDLKHVIRNEKFNYLPPFKAALMSLGITQNVFINIAKGAKKSQDYDFIVMDTDSVFDEDKTVFFGIADKVLIVTRQNKASVVATNALVSNINGMNTEKYIFVCNDFDKEGDNALISPLVSVNFTVNEYVEHLHHYDKLKAFDFGEYMSFEKVAYLLV